MTIVTVIVSIVIGCFAVRYVRRRPRTVNTEASSNVEQETSNIELSSTQQERSNTGRYIPLQFFNCDGYNELLSSADSNENVDSVGVETCTTNDTAMTTGDEV